MLQPDYFDPTASDSASDESLAQQHELQDAKQKREFNKLQKRLRREVYSATHRLIFPW